MFANVNHTIDSINAVIAESTATDAMLNDAMTQLIEAQYTAVMNAYSHFQEKFPTVDAVEIQMAVSKAQPFTEMQERVNAATTLITDEIQRRHPDI